jgi:hypothetical protein
MFDERRKLDKIPLGWKLEVVLTYNASQCPTKEVLITLSRYLICAVVG